jgi:hypothetical protein
MDDLSPDFHDVAAWCTFHLGACKKHDYRFVALLQNLAEKVVFQEFLR